MSRLTLEHVHTGNQSGPGNENHVVVKFQALMVDLPKDIEGNGITYTNGDELYVTAGASYGNGDFVWIGHVPVIHQHEENVGYISLFPS